MIRTCVIVEQADAPSANSKSTGIAAVDGVSPRQIDRLGKGLQIDGASSL